MTRKIKAIYQGRETLEGAGVRLKRVFGARDVPRFDPFLMLDDFGSRDPDDYMAGFPWHPHRGIETVTYMLHGAVRHSDSMGNKGEINDGRQRHHPPGDAPETAGLSAWLPALG
jgi:redox-sensitive bicupin YhaK (pirin superfamily)